MQLFAVVMVAVLAVGARGKAVQVSDNEIPSGAAEDRGFAAAAEDPAWRYAGRVLDACGDKELAACLGAKAVAALGRAEAAPRIALLPGLALVRSADAPARDAKALASEAEVHNSLEQGAAAGDQVGRLADMLLEAAARFFRSHVLQFRLPEGAAQPLQRALDEGRGKKKILKTLMPLIMGIGLKLMALLPIGLGVIGLLAAKALLVSKVALILAGVLAAQKLLGSGGGLSGLGSAAGWASGNSGGGWSSSPPAAAAAGWASSGPGSSSYYRSFDADAAASAHDIAYKAQAPQN
ncbi:uncharacterized protein LOC134534585 [Bacillus rossius redtenbacheri]|uniref:uncharacterized protein LOC134534585 n=1 Tax=Bacillus rossius redtenbacheri TaxID=93214 RepID=UPI002FDD292C